MPITTIFVKGESFSITLQEIVQHTISNIECIYYLTFHSSGIVPVEKINK